MGQFCQSVNPVKKVFVFKRDIEPVQQGCVFRLKRALLMVFFLPFDVTDYGV